MPLNSTQRNRSRLFMKWIFLAAFTMAIANTGRAQGRGKVYLFGGFGLSKLHSDSLSLRSSFLPCAGIFYKHPLFPNASISIDLHYTMAGSNTDDNTIRFRNQYAGAAICPQYEPMDFLRLYAGFYCDALLSQRVGILSGTQKSGLNWEPGHGYSSGTGVMAGVGIRLDRVLWLHLQKVQSVSGGKYSNFQFTISFSPADIKVEPRGKKYLSLPDALANKGECKRLVIMNENLIALPSEVAGLDKLRELVLDFNSLHSLPPEIGNLVQLRRLSVKYNKLDSLPAAIGLLVNVEELDLSENQLRYLPKEIGKMKALRFLVIGKNHLEALPASIGELTNLVELDISKSGPMLKLPDISKLKSLETLYIDRYTQFPIPFTLPNARLNIVIKD